MTNSPIDPPKEIAPVASAKAAYWKAERDRLEDCMSDISDIVSTAGDADKQIDAVIDRIIAHYRRVPR